MSGLTPAQATMVSLAEKDLQRTVLELAQRLGWAVAHFRPALTRRGWRTAVAADGAGFPDLVLLRGERILVRELKVGGNKLTADQQRWLERFRGAAIDADVWTENDLHGRILEELK